MNDSDNAIGHNENSVSQGECDDSDGEMSDNPVQTNGNIEQSSADVSQDGSQKDGDSAVDGTSDSDEAGKENDEAESVSDSSEDSSEEEGVEEVESKNNTNQEDEAVSLPDSDDDDSSQDDENQARQEEKKVTNVIYVGDNANWQGKSGDNSPMVLSDSDEYEDEDPTETSQSSEAALRFLNINKELTIEGLTVKKKPAPVDIKSLNKPATIESSNYASITLNKQPNNTEINNKSKSTQQVALEAIYSNIAARGITLTPVPKQKTSAPVPVPVASTNSQIQAITQVNQTNNSQPQNQQIILSSLTDDMFVVEAPSFIVPYVYEKPPIIAFREYVDNLKKELAANKDIDTSAIDDFDIDLSSLKDLESTAQQDAASKKRKSKKNTDEDYSWDGKTSDSESESDEEKPKPAPDKANETATGAAKPAEKPLDNYFVKPLGTFFMNIGMNLVKEHVQRDLLKQQKRKLYKENRTGEGDPKLTEAAIVSLMKNIESSRDKNHDYKYEMKKCSFCSFQSESSLVVSHHLETPHMKSNLYKCNFCEYEIKSPHDILYHMEAEHNIRGRLERAPSYHPCANCPFEDNGKSKLARHMIACAKKFKPEHNLAPPLEWEPPAKISKVPVGRPYRGYQPVANKQPPMMAKPNAIPAVNQFVGIRKPAVTAVNQKPIQGAPLFKGGVMYRNNQQIVPNNDYRLLQGGQTTIRLESNKSSAKPVQHHPSISITPLPRAAPAPVVSPQVSANTSKATFVICEICDGYIKDLEQLRNHMMWIHKVKIHPKMIYNRPPLNCQKCQFRFFTDQGLERHLLGSHGLVTSSMQEAANKNKDAGRCPACGKVFQWKLLNHVARDHNMTLKPAYLSYKCTVCAATFGMYKLFENHVYSAHSGVARRVT